MLLLRVFSKASPREGRRGRGGTDGWHIGNGGEGVEGRRVYRSAVEVRSAREPRPGRGTSPPPHTPRPRPPPPSRAPPLEWETCWKFAPRFQRAADGRVKLPSSDARGRDPRPAPPLHCDPSTSIAKRSVASRPRPARPRCIQSLSREGYPLRGAGCLYPGVHQQLKVPGGES